MCYHCVYMIILSRSLKITLAIFVVMLWPIIALVGLGEFLGWRAQRHAERVWVQQNQEYPQPTSTRDTLPSASTPEPVVNQGYLFTLEEARRKLESGERVTANITELLLAPRDEKHRPLLTIGLAEFLVREGWSLPEELAISRGWYEGIDLSNLRPIRVDQEGYVLTVPYDVHWGNARFGVRPYELSGGEEGVFTVFGPITHLENEMVGVQRPIDFRSADKRTEAEALADEDSFVGEEWCGSRGRRAIPTDIVRIGTFRALRLEDRGCEGGSISYEVFGREQNYLFTAHGLIPNDALLRWTIERFQEK